jgi:tryptophan synthase alpha chain
MSRIGERFAQLKSDGRKGFIPFITAGDPDVEASLAIMLKLAELGADVIELGVPFSDPMADGPTIQRSSQRALQKGTTLTDVLRLAGDFRQRSNVPVVLFSYLNPVYRFGLEEFAIAGEMAGIDGLLLTDAIEHEAELISDRLSKSSIDLISLVAPTTSDDRLGKICEKAKGFIYAVSRAGVTGARSDTSSGARLLVDRVRKFTDLPVAVGFGISTNAQVNDVWEYADAAVVGSAIVAEIERSADPDSAIRNVGSFVKGLLPEVAKTAPEN